MSATTTSAAADEGILPPERLARYADAIVASCLGLAEGDTLFVECQPAHRKLAIGLAESAYRMGARLVDVDYAEVRAQAARIRYAREEHLGPVAPWVSKKLRAQVEPTAATVRIVGEGDPGALDDLPTDRIVADTQRPLQKLAWFMRAVKENRRRWAAAAWPTPPWAAQAYPELEAADGMRRLAEDLLWFCRLGPDDPPGAEGWERHVDEIAGRAGSLTELQLVGVELRGPGTALDLRLAPGTRWIGGRERNAHGQLVSPNFPTEETFTSPDAAATEGTFRCSRPLSFRGRLIEGISGELSRGRLVRLEAERDEDRELLAAYLSSDRDAGRLGEVALVDRSSRIGKTERVYSNTLIDENAAAHIAFGLGFRSTRLPDENARGARGVNASNLHLDLMVGTDDFDASGIAADGRRIPLLADGAWQIP